MTPEELEFWEGLGNYFFICYLNGITEAKEDFINSEGYLDGVASLWHSECKELFDDYEKRL